MPIRTDTRFKNRLRFDITKIVDKFPADLKARTLAELDACALASGIPTIFALQTCVDELRLALTCYLQHPKFKRAFCERFSGRIGKFYEYAAFGAAGLLDNTHFTQIYVPLF